jgi:large subunit ribosomal protein L4
MDNQIFLDELEKKKKERIGLIHKVFLSQLKTNRKYTACTKTKSEVRGGGRKPWRQKGTGQARAGSTRSPLFVGGGVTFGPKPRKVEKKINRKEKALAILSAFYLKQKQVQIVPSELLDQSTNSKSKKTVHLLKTLAISPEEKTLLIVPSVNQGLYLSLRNIKNLELCLANCLNLNTLLNSHHILLSSASMQLINETYGKAGKRSKTN